MLTYHKGNVLEAPVNIIVHGCNCRGVMGAGIAAQIAAKWPKVYKQYKNFCESTSDPEILLGLVQLVEISDNLTIANAFTQRDYARGKRMVSYDAIDSAMHNIALCVRKDAIIGMPKIGAGLGGGNWGIIEKIIAENLYKHDVRVYEL